MEENSEEGSGEEEINRTKRSPNKSSEEDDSSSSSESSSSEETPDAEKPGEEGTGEGMIREKRSPCMPPSRRRIWRGNNKREKNRKSRMS